MLFKNAFEYARFEEYLVEKCKLSDVSLVHYLRNIRYFLSTVTDLDNIEAYNNYLIRHSLKIHNATTHAVVKLFIKYRFENPVQRAEMLDKLVKYDIDKSNMKERRHLSEKEILTIVNNIKSERNRVIAMLQMITGARSGDIMRIKRGNIVPEVLNDSPVVKLIVYGKGNKRAVFFVYDELIQALLIEFTVRYHFSFEYYFIIENKNIKRKYFGEIFIDNYQNYYRDMRQAMAKVGVDFHDFATHDYRRCFARRVWTKYKDFHVLQQMLNHSNPASTMKYLRQSGMQNADYQKEIQLGL